MCPKEIIFDLFSITHTEHKKNLFRENLNCVKAAWKLVKDKLPEYGKQHKKLCNCKLCRRYLFDHTCNYYTMHMIN